MRIIRIADHVSNADQTARIVYTRPGNPGAVYQVSLGFVVSFGNSLAINGHFGTLEAACAALATVPDFYDEGSK